MFIIMAFAALRFAPFGTAYPSAYASQRVVLRVIPGIHSMLF